MSLVLCQLGWLRGVAIAFAWWVVMLAPVVVQAGPPNIVYFLVDDLGRQDCGFAGGKSIRTPRIDKLASEGCTLSAFYAQPLCSPTRAALLTGRYPYRYGLQVGPLRVWEEYGLPVEETTLADDLQAAGYTTAIFGKWHLGHASRKYLPLQRGFTKQYGNYVGALDYFTHEREGGLDWHEDERPLREEGYTTELIAQHVVEFVEQQPKDKPFFLYVPFNAVHDPWHPPKGGADEYPELQGNRRKYAGMLTAADQAIGEIVDAIERAGLRENTLFIFSSDNGGPSPGKVTDNGPYRGGKRQLYEGGIRVAAFATWDGKIPAGSETEEPMHVVDWRPTLLKLCGASSAGTLPVDGLDIWPTIAQGKASPHESIVLNISPVASAILVGDWKLIVTPVPTATSANGKGEEKMELFDLASDPYERTNLASAEPEKVAELKSLLAAHARDAVPAKGDPRPRSFQAPKVWGDVAD